jgi:PAS domain S-box-containing protein
MRGRTIKFPGSPWFSRNASGDPPNAREAAAPAKPSTTNQRLIILEGLALIYFVTGKFGLHFAHINPSASPIWMPAGFAIVGFLLFGYWVWPAVLLGAFFVNLTTTGSVVTSLFIAIGNTVEGVAGAYLVNRFANGKHVFERVQDTVRFLALAALGSSMLSATIGVTSLCIGHYTKWSNYASIWATWWLGDASGVLIVAPVLLLWAKNRVIIWNSTKTVELGMSYVVLVAACAIVFGDLVFPANFPTDFICVPVLLWIALRFEPRDTSVATLIVAILALIGTLNGHGPFAGGTPHEDLLLLELFVGIIGLMSLSVAIEATERRRLSGAHARLAEIVEYSDDSIVSAAFDGEITTWNPAAERMFGYSPAEAIGQNISLIIPAEQSAEARNVLARIRRGEEVRHFETTRRTRDGRLLNVSLTVSPIKNANGEIIGASKVARDFTEETRLRREQQRLLTITEEESKAKDEFLAMLGHELRNPLAALATAIHVSASAGGRADIAEKAQSIITRQIDHLSRMVDDLLDAARVATGRIALYRRPTNIAECIAECIVAIRLNERIDAYDLRVDAAPVWVSADPDRLAQIITNVLNNAIRYTPAGDRIDVIAKAEGDLAIVQIKDCGIGIGPELLSHIFNLFRQGERGLDRSEGGLGIGLTLVKRLVELHGGTVEAASEGVNCGSCFTVSLPLIAPPVRVQPDLASQEREIPPRCRVLVVEDNADAREGIRALLELDGHEVFEAEDGPSGVEAAALGPDVALIDIGLPRLDGFEVAKQIRLNHATRETILIAITGYGQQGYREKAKRVGFHEYLVKPINPGQLSEVVKKHYCRDGRFAKGH